MLPPAQQPFSPLLSQFEQRLQQVEVQRCCRILGLVAETEPEIDDFRWEIARLTRSEGLTRRTESLMRTFNVLENGLPSDLQT